MLDPRFLYRGLRSWAEKRRSLRRDEATGLLCQITRDGPVFLRDPDAFLPQAQIDRLCQEVYFREYCPKPGDTVVDVGAGYGHEALFCLKRSPGVRYIGVEVQPSVYECLANTFAPHRPALRAFSLAISSSDPLWLRTQYGREYEDVQVTDEGAVEVPTISWNDFLSRFDIERIALLKVNIEGGERHLLPDLGRLTQVDRVIISAHDFRAARGEGEHFRTRQFVVDYLTGVGFTPRSLGTGPWWSSWIFASR